MKLYLALAFLGTVMFFVDDANAICCPNSCQSPIPLYHCRCDDGHKGNPYCGVGKCNMFSCGCKDGCREGKEIHLEKKGKAMKVTKSGTDAADVVKKMDLNKDGCVDKHETFKLIFGTKEYLYKKFSHFDKDQDGCLSADEIDTLE